ncbi:MAG: class I SAM-dependent methyltransferase, partial [Anaerolineae bacterium]|nr:class I SAM-dependent methyltransferase [Anaerolineae bacterium]
EDHFSEQAQDYVRYRPQYPPELFTYLASIAPGRQLAWDCGTGNGQAALSLAEHFDRVIATDASADQITHAAPHPRISYRVERAEDIDLDANSLDLVTVAIAVHWFDFDSFYQAVRRVLKPGGILAVWTYHLPAIEPAIDRLLTRYYGEVLAGYWPERFRYVDARYRTLPFPFTELTPPQLEMQTDWTLTQVAGFLSSWSATRQYVKARQQHPLEAIWPELTDLWGDAEHTRTLHWPLHIRIGRAD